MTSLARRMFTAGLVLLTLFSSTSPAMAQEFGIPPTTFRRAPLPDHAQLMLNELHRPALITLLDGTTLRGNIGDATATELVLQMDQQSLVGARLGVPWAQISSVRVQRRYRILEGVLAGGAGGALYGILTPVKNDIDRKLMGMEAPDHMWDSALQGAVIGAVLGLVGGLDVFLPLQPQDLGIGTIRAAGQRPTRPSHRLITTAPLQSLTLREIESSIEESSFLPGIEVPNSERSWNGHQGSSIAVETSWPWDAAWWLRSRMEWTSLPRLQSTTATQAAGPLAGPFHLWREHSSFRSLIGFARPFGSVSRLPLLEISFMGGVSYATLRSGGYFETAAPPTPLRVSSKQKVIRPIMMATASLALLRRPTFGVALRAEGMIGPGFSANALINNGEILIPKRRITPIGFALGLEIYLPRF
jgi:hypothetical protein